MRDKWYCSWCGKHRVELPTREQQTILTNEWKPLCSVCVRKRGSLSLKGPFYGGLMPTTRPIQAALEEDKT